MSAKTLKTPALSSTLMINLKNLIISLSDVDDMLTAASDLRHEIDRRFREKEIVIAFPQRDLHLRSVDESPGSILTPPGDQRPELVVVPTKEKDEGDE